MKEKIAYLRQNKKLEILGSFLLLAIVTLPIFSFAGHKDQIYVDSKASGEQTGSSSHPYKTIKEALRHAGKNSQVHLAPGTYNENIEIPKGVEIFGKDPSKVTIDGKDKKAVVRMKDDTRIDGITIKGGLHGIEVLEDAEVSIIECKIKDNDKDGIRIKEGSTRNKNAVSITDSIIEENGRSGIFSQKRRVVIMNNEIRDNGNDGITLSIGVSSWIQGNRFKNNDGSGMRIDLDFSEIWTKNNTFYGNNHEGVEVNSFGSYGILNLKKSKFYGNSGYGVALIQRVPQANWSGFGIQPDAIYSENGAGNISPIFRLY